MSALTSWPEQGYNWEVIWHSLAGAVHARIRPGHVLPDACSASAGRYDLHRQASGAFYGHAGPRFAGSHGCGHLAGPGLHGAAQDPAHHRRPALEVRQGLHAARASVGNAGGPGLPVLQAPPGLLQVWRGGGDPHSLPATAPRSQVSVQPQDVSKGFRSTPCSRMSATRAMPFALGAAKALCLNKRFGEIEKLLRDPDPRLRRAGPGRHHRLQPVVRGSRRWGRHALKADEYTPAMIDAITEITARSRRGVVRDGWGAARPEPCPGRGDQEEHPQDPALDDPRGLVAA